jgi:hypothetical protein
MKMEKQAKRNLLLSRRGRLDHTRHSGVEYSKAIKLVFASYPILNMKLPCTRTMQFSIRVHNKDSIVTNQANRA